MTVNEIKKALYKQKPTARLTSVENPQGTHSQLQNIYTTHLWFGRSSYELKFKVPRDEASGFEREMEAHLLIRWMI